MVLIYKFALHFVNDGLRTKIRCRRGRYKKQRSLVRTDESSKTQMKQTPTATTIGGSAQVYGLPIRGQTSMTNDGRIRFPLEPHTQDLPAPRLTSHNSATATATKILASAVRPRIHTPPTFSDEACGSRPYTRAASTETHPNISRQKVCCFYTSQSIVQALP